jgi:cytochrome c peroxidase
MWMSQFLSVEPEPAPPKIDPRLIDLGRDLFFERALSPDGARSCNDCHDLSTYGTNGEAAVKARENGTLKRDVPSVYNLSSLDLLCWDGAQTNLQSRVSAALTHPDESALVNGKAAVKKLLTQSAYPEKFANTFGTGAAALTYDQIVQALTAFLKDLKTAPSPFDDFLGGNDQALSADQLKGASLFDEKNCSACHTGTTIGGQMLQKAGILYPWPNQKDRGHAEVSGNAAHTMLFRVPPLLNVAETAPYFHDHSGRNLRRAIRDIGLREQGLFLGREEILLIESFMESFTGKIPEEYRKPPTRSEKGT